MIIHVLSIIEIKNYSTNVLVALLIVFLFIRFPSYGESLENFFIGISHMVPNMSGVFLLSLKQNKVQDFIRRDNKKLSIQIESFDSILKKLASSMIFILRGNEILFDNELKFEI